jgi:hypothetical protein
MMAKLFGLDAKRVTTEEMQAVHKELASKIGGQFCAFDLTRTLEEKKDHGDIDILVLTHPEQNARKVVEEILQPEKVVKNGHCLSCLYNSFTGRVHVDFLISGDPNLHATKTQYYAFNDLSATVGVMAKALNFKYGTDGFFKRYQDKRGNWHDIIISVNLNPGLECLGLEPKPLWIKTYNDIANYVSGSLLFDSEMYSESLEKVDEVRRAGRVWQGLARQGKKAAITDADYFFKRKYPGQYAEVQDKIKEIEDRAYQQSRFNGWWLMEKFGVKPGKEVGLLLKALSDHFGDRLGDVSEEEVITFVKGLLGDEGETN